MGYNYTHRGLYVGCIVYTYSLFDIDAYCVLRSSHSSPNTLIVVCSLVSAVHGFVTIIMCCLIGCVKVSSVALLRT